ncbi:hypothetical protein BB560_001321 [Smittium megazygosporum]|uniref:Peptide hydrolase n=1 Tax=Smittium megazygosporum TaxID=133381 RepID=A0A2T9ZHV2_9FUNG|nr:hypothetical protein BB560_001321 [Smittium megazygosporum]
MIRSRKSDSTNKSEDSNTDKPQTLNAYPSYQLHIHFHPGSSNSSYKMTALYYGSLILVYLVVFLVVVLVRAFNNNYSPPDGKYIFPVNHTALTDPQPPTVDTKIFRADVAFEYLRYLARTPHPWNTQANQDNLDYISKTLFQLQDLAKKNGVIMEVITDDPTNFITYSTEETMFSPSVSTNSSVRTSVSIEGRNVLARIIGLNNNTNNAILLSSHVDSVQVSYGATDDGINGAVMLEIARHIIFNRLQSTIVFNFNDGEEIGLYGALAFMHHEWSKTIKAFINIEGAGAGGSALVFRSSNYDVVKHFSQNKGSYVSKWRPHANVFANDAFKLGLINSGTDYTTYTAYNIPGLDIAFYERRSLYHTSSDSIDHVPIGSIQQVGGVVLNTIKSMSDDQKLLAKDLGETDGVSIYYDVLGRSMVAHTFGVMYGIYIALIVILVSTPFILKYVVSRVREGKRVSSAELYSSIDGHSNFNVSKFVRSTSFSILAIIFSFGITLIISVALKKKSFFAVYGHYYLVAATHALGNVFMICLVMLLWIVIEEKAIKRSGILSAKLASRALTYSQVFIWLFGIIIALVLALVKGAGLLYYTAYYAGFSFLAALFCYFVETREDRRKPITYVTWLIRLIIAIPVPSVILIDLTGILINGLAQTVIDGTSPFMVNLLIGVLTTTVVAPIMPFVVTPGKKKLSILTLFMFVSFMALFIPSMLIKPFDSSAPDHVYVISNINATTKVENTTLLSNRALGSGFTDLIKREYPNTPLNIFESSDSGPEKYHALLLGDNGFAAAFKENNVDFPSYTVSKNVSSTFTGKVGNRDNAVLVSISAPRSYICEVATERVPRYLYTIPSYAYSELGFTPPENVTKKQDTIFPGENDEFGSYKYDSAPEFFGQSLYMLTKNPDSKWLVYLEHGGNGFGEITLQCHYGEMKMLMPQTLKIEEWAISEKRVLGSFHSSSGLLTITDNIVL